MQPSIIWGEEFPMPDEAVFNALIVIAVRLAPNVYRALGTGFIIGSSGHSAAAVSAAHVFDEIYKIQNPQQPQPWKPFQHVPPQMVDLDAESVFGIVFQNGRSHTLRLLDLMYDTVSDVAVFTITKKKVDSRPIFTTAVHLDSSMPDVGTEIEAIGFRNMDFSPKMVGQFLVTEFRAALVRRSGKITEILQRGILLKGPGAVVSFPIFGGMSGGPVLRLGTGKAPAAFGLLTSDMDSGIDTATEKDDRTREGFTTVAKLPISWDFDKTGQRVLAFKFLSNDIGRSIDLVSDSSTQRTASL